MCFGSSSTSTKRDTSPRQSKYVGGYDGYIRKLQNDGKIAVPVSRGRNNAYANPVCALGAAQASGCGGTGANISAS